MTNIRKILNETTLSSWLIFAMMTMTLFVMNCLFHYYAFGSILVSTLWKNPLVFLEFYGIKFFIASGLSCWVFCFKRIEWTWILIIAANIWIEANLMYFRNSGFFIDTSALLMATNLQGYISAISIYWHQKDWVFVVLSCSYVILTSCIYFISSKHRKKIWVALVIFVVSVTMHSILRYTQEQRLLGEDVEYKWNVFAHNTRKKTYQEILLIKEHSILHAFFFDIVDLIVLKNDKYTLTGQDYQFISQMLGEAKQPDERAKESLIVVLVESFETWVLTKDIMPHLWQFIHNDNVFYAPQVLSQIKQGTSSDGQLIITTGLLPITEGATVFRFPHDSFPSFNQWYDRSILLNPCGEIWNQKRMTEAYHYLDYIEWQEQRDAYVIDSAITVFSQVTKPLSMCVITSSTHAPFTINGLDWTYKVPPEMPNAMARYIQSFHYLDQSLRPLLDRMLTDSVFANTVLVIAADHKVFDEENRRMFRDYCSLHNMDLNPQLPYTPLIIYSPSIQQNTIYSSIAYQMDIYPTIQGLVLDSVEDIWRGVGRNLLYDSSSTIDEETAYILSDKIIRGNYFKSRKCKPN